MKKLLLLTFAFCLIIGMSSLIAVESADALTVKWETADYFAWGSVYDPNFGTSFWEPSNTPNPFDGSGTQNLPFNDYQAGDGTEDAFGITRITRIANIPGTNELYNANTAGYELTAFFYGADDVFIGDPNLVQVPQYVDGFRVDIWRDNSFDYASDSVVLQGTAGRTAIDEYLGVTGLDINGDPDDTTLLMSWVGHTQFIDCNPDADGNCTSMNEPFTLVEQGQPSTGQFTGGILFDVVPGSGPWASIYDTNLIPGGLSDSPADIQFSFSTFGNPGVSDWNIGDTSNLVANVPEPATIIMLGSGLLGIGFFGKKRFGGKNKSI